MSNIGNSTLNLQAVSHTWVYPVDEIVAECRTNPIDHHLVRKHYFSVLEDSKLYVSNATLHSKSYLKMNIITLHKG